MSANCCYCESPVEFASAFYAGQPIHPECEIAFRAEMDASFPDEDMDVEPVDEDCDCDYDPRYDEDNGDPSYYDRFDEQGDLLSDYDEEWEGDGQPLEYDGWQDYMGDDYWDQGQYDYDY